MKDSLVLGSDGLVISRIGAGAWQLGNEAWGKDVDSGQGVAAVVGAFKQGVNFVDTAEVYADGGSERLVGEVLKEIGRNNVVLATKVAKHLRYRDVKRACENSLERMGVDFVDLYQVHWPDPWQQIPLKETMEAMEDLFREGKIKSVGVSNFAVRDLKEAEKYLDDLEIVSNQVRYNLLERQIEEEVLPYCRENSIAVLAYSPLAQGLLTGKYGPENMPTDKIRGQNPLFKEKNVREIRPLISVLTEISEKRGKTVTQVALNWVIEKEGVAAIAGVKTPRQAEENAGAMGWRLREEEKNGIEVVLEEIEIDFF